MINEVTFDKKDSYLLFYNIFSPNPNLYNENNTDIIKNIDNKTYLHTPSKQISTNNAADNNSNEIEMTTIVFL